MLGIHPGSGCKGPNLLGTGSQGYQNSMEFPFLLPLGFLKEQRKANFS